MAQAVMLFQRGKALFPLSFYFLHHHHPFQDMERDHSFAIVYYVYLSRLGVVGVTILTVLHRK